MMGKEGKNGDAAARLLTKVKLMCPKRKCDADVAKGNKALRHQSHVGAADTASAVAVAGIVAVSGECVVVSACVSGDVSREKKKLILTLGQKMCQRIAGGKIRKKELLAK